MKEEKEKSKWSVSPKVKLFTLIFWSIMIILNLYSLSKVYVWEIWAVWAVISICIGIIVIDLIIITTIPKFVLKLLDNHIVKLVKENK